MNGEKEEYNCKNFPERFYRWNKRRSNFEKEGKKGEHVSFRRQREEEGKRKRVRVNDSWYIKKKLFLTVTPQGGKGN